MSCAKNKHIKKRKELKELRVKLLRKKILNYSFPIALQESVYSLSHWLSMLIMVKLSTYGEVGILSAANQWGAILLFIPGALRNVALTYFSRGSQESNKSISEKLVSVNLLSTIIPFIFVSIFSKFICKFYGDEFVGMTAVLIIVCFQSIINAISNVYTQELMANSKNWYLFISRLIRDLLSIVIAYFAILLYGNGALIMALTLTFTQLIYLVLLYKKVKNEHRET